MPGFMRGFRSDRDRGWLFDELRESGGATHQKPTMDHPAYGYEYWKHYYSDCELVHVLWWDYCGILNEKLVPAESFDMMFHAHTSGRHAPYDFVPLTNNATALTSFPDGKSAAEKIWPSYKTCNLIPDYDWSFCSWCYAFDDPRPQSTTGILSPDRPPTSTKRRILSPDGPGLSQPQGFEPRRPPGSTKHRILSPGAWSSTKRRILSLTAPGSTNRRILSLTAPELNQAQDFEPAERTPELNQAQDFEPDGPGPNQTQDFEPRNPELNQPQHVVRTETRAELNQPQDFDPGRDEPRAQPAAGF